MPFSFLLFPLLGAFPHILFYVLYGACMQYFLYTPATLRIFDYMRLYLNALQSPVSRPDALLHAHDAVPVVCFDLKGEEIGLTGYGLALLTALCEKGEVEGGRKVRRRKAVNKIKYLNEIK